MTMIPIRLADSLAGAAARLHAGDRTAFARHED
jgi:hypothetical protein